MSGKNGPGKYDPECTSVLVATKAVCVVMLVIHGDRGTGFSVTSQSPEVLTQLPEVLRHLADSIEGADN